MGFYSALYASSVEVVDNSEKWSFQRLAEPSASVSLWVPGSLAYAVIRELMAPLNHPRFPFMYVKTVSMFQLGKGTASGHTMEHEKCQLDVTYTPWEKATYTESISIQAQMITLPKWMFRWSDGRMPADGEEPSRIVRTQKITHAYDRLAGIPAWAYTDVGKVNSSALTTAQGLVCAAETLLYEGAETNRQIDTYGTLGWQMTTNFSYNPNGWNRWYNAVAARWLTLKKYDSTAPGWTEFKMYELADLSGKF